jgi:hypothetical protein
VTPKEFKARYTNLKVKRQNGTIETVRVSKYVLNNSSSSIPMRWRNFESSFSPEASTRISRSSPPPEM